MNRDQLTQEVLEATPRFVSKRTRLVSFMLMGLGLAGLLYGFAGGAPAAGWVALLVSTALAIGLAVAGVCLSAIFQLTNARWGRSYRRLAEAGVVLMPVGLAGLIVFMAGAGDLLPWAHAEHLTGGKAVWLRRGFWDIRVLALLLGMYAVSLTFLYYSLRRDFCLAEVSKRFSGRLGAFLARDIRDSEAERRRCEARLGILAPAVLICFAVVFTFLGIDLIMALEPEWFSTLFGAWYFVGHLFSGLALLAILSIVLRPKLGLQRFLSNTGQRDLATLLFAFVLINVDFFWCQYMTIWYGNLPEETGYVITRALDASQPYRYFSWLSLAAFFVIPFIALLFRKVKGTQSLLLPVAAVVTLGILLARFVEVAPPLLRLERGSGLPAVVGPFVSTLLVFGGVLGAGLLLYHQLLTRVPIMPVGDPVFVQTFSSEEQA